MEMIFFFPGIFKIFIKLFFRFTLMYGFAIVSKEYFLTFATFLFCLNPITRNHREPGETAKIMFTICTACGVCMSSENS